MDLGDELKRLEAIIQTKEKDNNLYQELVSAYSRIRETGNFQLITQAEQLGFERLKTIVEKEEKNPTTGKEFNRFYFVLIKTKNPDLKQEIITYTIQFQKKR
jgi:hypothetical protein